MIRRACSFIVLYCTSFEPLQLLFSLPVPLVTWRVIPRRAYSSRRSSSYSWRVIREIRGSLLTPSHLSRFSLRQQQSSPPAFGKFVSSSSLLHVSQPNSLGVKSPRSAVLYKHILFSCCRFIPDASTILSCGSASHVPHARPDSSYCCCVSFFLSFKE